MALSRDLEGFLPISPPAEHAHRPYLPSEDAAERGTLQEANMGEVVQFIPKAERERIRLIREARAIYDSVFPSTNSVNEQRDTRQ
jgi:hypothetical protein